METKTFLKTDKTEPRPMHIYLQSVFFVTQGPATHINKHGINLSLHHCVFEEGGGGGG